MKYRVLGHTDLKLSALCLGTMTYGEQNSEAEAHAQLDRAVDAGINFIDTAEMYPVPPKADTQGLTEHHIGTWLASRGHRDRLIIATKVAGPADWLSYLRDGNLHHDRVNIEAAVDQSLQRLQTDYIDIYQLHWPDRQTNYFGKLGYQAATEEQATPILETLQVLSELQRAGKIRHIGVSNETPWGVSQFLQLAEKHDLPRIVTIQNPYNLLNRTYEIGLAEISHREKCGLLAYSPMAFGTLSGKYLAGRKPDGARLTLFSRFDRYSSPQTLWATEEYVALARRQGLKPAQMALAFVTSRPFVTSNIIGATTLAQLDENIESIDISLSPEVLQEIETIHKRQPNPAP
ncbi:MAG: NADP(H)-dependent aldo-keto reductase [gamma proteobacterium symbiont of Ctena orbiculata]|uniref:Protein tas n=1 Tax=Candidatus Thiodiazotropha taylori TaxID=2792791 RepID=A0A944QR81_9GAMM|nr:NADP(H)-dependent aldo-keto reductase [Candidatus Thiodiazotropha taylori]PUB89049.1 MAG: NADP(H)-dependent aldo-keto reductase [gamma proteobacterium symbiont of Ctena orbiculata]MBT2987483.1 NADP(H)-dependent aldo-keto reductase [Candidatus Thiodiazotropha taylori]MBT2995261.1 NADP(H)-dependent aldo-keto reductase [Candidatus Thiodiazotropha taylori]MBT2999820.1 NADP(H)-dependent aldo-keto reductase [Candidatus Thiodiazotropha taylori]